MGTHWPISQPRPFQHEGACSDCNHGFTSTLVIAAQKLYYGGYPNQGGAIFITMATQRKSSLQTFIASRNGRLLMYLQSLAMD
jgi:hypothetical protein